MWAFSVTVVAGLDVRLVTEQAQALPDVTKITGTLPCWGHFLILPPPKETPC